jgi:hypothetical protein
MRLNTIVHRLLAERGEHVTPALTRLSQELDRRLVFRDDAARKNPMLSFPLVLDLAEHHYLRHSSLVLSALAGTVHERVFGDIGATMDALRVPDVLRPFVSEPAPLGISLSRCDFLHGTDGWKSAEINVSGSSGDLLVDDYNRCLREDPVLADLLAERSLTSQVPAHLLALAVRDRCAELPIDGKPVVAIVDWQEFGPSYAHQHARIADHYRALGFDAIVCHQREMRFEHGRLWRERRPVHVVHRQFLLEDIASDPESALPVLRAAASGAVVIVSGFREEWLGSKAFFAVLHAARGRGLLTAEEAGVVDSVVPRTWLLTEHDAGDIGVRPADLPPPASLVLKPLVGSSGAGVVLGPSVSAGEFGLAVASALDSGEPHVVQEFVNPAPTPFAWLDGDLLTLDEGQPHPGFFVAEGEFIGTVTRVLRGSAVHPCGTEFGAVLGGVVAPADHKTASRTAVRPSSSR